MDGKSMLARSQPQMGTVALLTGREALSVNALCPPLELFREAGEKPPASIWLDSVIHSVRRETKLRAPRKWKRGVQAWTSSISCQSEHRAFTVRMGWGRQVMVVEPPEKEAQ